MFNPVPTGQGRNQPLYEHHVTKSGRNRVNCAICYKNSQGILIRIIEELKLKNHMALKTIPALPDFKNELQSAPLIKFRP